MATTESLNETPDSRPVPMPDGITRIVTLPGWAWEHFDGRNPDNLDYCVRRNWSKAHLRNFDRFLLSHVHSQERLSQKMAFFIRLSDSGLIPGEGARIPANDVYDPSRLPPLSDPWWFEAPAHWLAEQGWLALKSEMRGKPRIPNTTQDGGRF